MALQKSFVDGLESKSPAEEGKIYQCAGCYRSNLKSEFVAFISKGEAYCRVCVKAAL